MSDSNDVKELRKALRKVGFSVILGLALAIFIAILAWNIFVMILGFVFSHALLVALVVTGYILWKRNKASKANNSSKEIVLAKNQDGVYSLEDNVQRKTLLDKIVDFCSGSRS